MSGPGVVDLLQTLAAVALGWLVGTAALAVLSGRKKADRHPGGRKGLVVDNLLMTAPMVPVTTMVLRWNELGESPVWIWLWVSILAGIMVWALMPATRHARLRTKAVHRYPPQ